MKSRSKAQSLRLILSAGLCLAASFILNISTAYAQEMEDYPIVRLRSLDKVTARTQTFEANVGNTVKFGSTFIKVQACRKTPPVEKPEAAAFLQIWEMTHEGEAQWVFSGWMFSSSPGLSQMDHPIYDVWVLDCLSEKVQEAPPADDPESREGEGELSDDEVPQAPDTEVQQTPLPEDSEAATSNPESDMLGRESDSIETESLND
jgi:hypothetical protein